MKRLVMFAVFSSAVPGAVLTTYAQSNTTKPGLAHTTVHRSTAARRPSTGCADLPVLGAAIPKADGCPKPLYALRYIDMVVGTGTPVSARKWLTVNYSGYLTDGTKFDSSLGTGPDGKPKEPITFPYGARQVITGWDTGFEGMNVGGKRRLFIPYELAYGELGRMPTIPPKAQLVFDLELVAVSDTPPAPKAPPAPPAGSTTPAGAAPGSTATPSGAIPPTTAPPVSKPAPATDPTKPTAIPPTTAPPAMTPKPQR